MTLRHAKDLSAGDTVTTSQCPEIVYSVTRTYFNLGTAYVEIENRETGKRSIAKPRDLHWAATTVEA